MFKKILLGLLVLLIVGVGVIYVMLPPVNIPLAMFRGGVEPDEEQLGQRVVVPDGFRFTLFATGLGSARMMRVTETGDLLVSSRGNGQIYLLYKDEDGDGKTDGKEILIGRVDDEDIRASELNAPTGLELHDGWLYVGEKDAIGRIRFDANARSTSGNYERFVTSLPGDGNHSSKTIRIGSDGWIYMNVGSSCNVCEEEDERRATMMRISLDGETQEIYATGLRNSVGFDWSPRDGALYATDNGRDLLGDDYPVEELNRIEEGGFYGWPYANDFGDADPDFGEGNEDKVAASISPAHGFRAHNATLGFTFLRHGRYRDSFHNDAIVALHGSWNRSEKDGYKVVRLEWSEDGSITETDFVTGLMVDSNVIGRPVDVVESEAGKIFISDDFSGAVYRVVYGEEGGSDATVDAQEIILLAALPEFSEEEVTRGESLYAANDCASCHGAVGDSQEAVPIVSLSTEYDLDSLADLLTTPPSSMPAALLTNEELVELAAYLFSKS